MASTLASDTAVTSLKLSHGAHVQVNSEFQAFKHIDIRSRGEMARAMKSLEATLALQPTLILTNSLPCSLDVIVWQVWALSASPSCTLVAALLPSLTSSLCLRGRF